VLRRLHAHWRLKLLLTVAVNAVFWSGYAFLGRHAFFPLWVPPTTWFDAAIPFRPEPWAWIYLSQFLFTGAVPWLIETKDALRRFVVGLVATSVVSFVCFLFFPVASPRVGMNSGAADGAMALIAKYDGAMNAFPSLHAGFLVYLALLVRRMFGPALPRAAVLAGVLWAGAILYATIATRQHYVVDLIAGAAVGALADWLAWRRSAAGVSAAMTMSRSSGVAFHDGCK
jgi:hypothetical protein